MTQAVAERPSMATNRFAENSSYGLISNDDPIYRAGVGISNPTKTEASMFLENYATKNSISGSSQEKKYKAMESIVESTLNDAEQAKAALASRDLSTRNKEVISKSFEKLRAKCQGLSGYAQTAGFNGDSFQSRLQQRVNKICND